MDNFSVSTERPGQGEAALLGQDFETLPTGDGAFAALVASASAGTEHGSGGAVGAGAENGGPGAEASELGVATTPTAENEAGSTVDAEATSLDVAAGTSAAAPVNAVHGGWGRSLRAYGAGGRSVDSRPAQSAAAPDADADPAEKIGEGGQGGQVDAEGRDETFARADAAQAVAPRPGGLADGETGARATKVSPPQAALPEPRRVDDGAAAREANGVDAPSGGPVATTAAGAASTATAQRAARAYGGGVVATSRPSQAPADAGAGPNEAANASAPVRVSGAVEPKTGPVRPSWLTAANVPSEAAAAAEPDTSAAATDGPASMTSAAAGVSPRCVAGACARAQAATVATLAARAGAAAGPSATDGADDQAEERAGGVDVASRAGAGLRVAADDEADAALSADTGRTPGLAELGAMLSLLHPGAAPQVDTGTRALDAVTSRSLAASMAPHVAAEAAQAVAPAGGRPVDLAASRGTAAAATEAGPEQTAVAPEDGEGLGATDAGPTRGAGLVGPSRRRTAAAAGDASGDGLKPSEAKPAADDATAAGRANLAQLQAPVPTPAERALTGASAALPQAQVSRELAEAVHHGGRSISLRVAPPGVGELGINVRVVGNQVRMRVNGEAPQLEQMLRNHLPALQQSLQERGLTLSSFDLRPRDDQQQSFGRDFDGGQRQPSQQEGGRNDGGQHFDEAAREGRGLLAREGRRAPAGASASRAPATDANARVLYVTF